MGKDLFKSTIIDGILNQVLQSEEPEPEGRVGRVLQM